MPSLRWALGNPPIEVAEALQQLRCAAAARATVVPLCCVRRGMVRSVCWGGG